jgi:hypothetical protein
MSPEKPEWALGFGVGAVADFDNDGLLDIYVTNQLNALFRNNGDGTFSDWTGAWEWATGGRRATFFDPDDDGADLCVGIIETTWDEVWAASASASGAAG